MLAKLAFWFQERHGFQLFAAAQKPVHYQTLQATVFEITHVALYDLAVDVFAVGLEYRREVLFNRNQRAACHSSSVASFTSWRRVVGYFERLYRLPVS